VADGLSGSQIQEYLKALVDLGQQAEQTGVKIDERSFTRTSGALSVAGFQGLQAQRVAAGFTQAAMQTGGQMVSPETYALHRAYGYNPEEGAESWARAAEKMQSGEGTPGALAKYAGMMGSGIRGAGYGPALSRQLMMQRFKAINVPISATQAQMALEGRIEASDFGPAAERWGEAERAGAPQRLHELAQRKLKRGGATGLLSGAAGMEAMQIGAGGRASWVLGFEKAGIDAANVISDFGKHLSLLSTVVRRAIREFRTLLHGAMGPPGPGPT
jgi:hypothetical protein